MAFKRYGLVVLIALLAVFAVFAVSGCPQAETPRKEREAPRDGPEEETDEEKGAVTIRGFTFTPGDMTVKAGEKVTWKNEDSPDHTVTSDDKTFDSGTLSNGQTFSFTFDEAGTYPYHCEIHPSMKAVITVTE